MWLYSLESRCVQKVYAEWFDQTAPLVWSASAFYEAKNVCFQIEKKERKKLIFWQSHDKMPIVKIY